MSLVCAVTTICLFIFAFFFSSPSLCFIHLYFAEFCLRSHSFVHRSTCYIFKTPYYYYNFTVGWRIFELCCHESNAHWCSVEPKMCADKGERKSPAREM